jgi:N-acetylglutamate synthase-like GNAT family acetyltransferase
MTIVELYDGDRRQLASLFALADDSPSQISSYLACGEVFVVREASVILGHAQLTVTDDPTTSELKSLAVQTAWRRRGIGAALLAAAVSHSCARGARRLLVATATADIDNLRFYQRRGFRMLRIERDVFDGARGYPDGFLVEGIPLRDQLWLELDLQARTEREVLDRAHSTAAPQTTPRSGVDQCDGAPSSGDRWETRHDLTPDEIDRLEGELYEFNVERTGYSDVQGLGFLVRRAGGLVGAVAGYTWGGVCELRQVWVRDDARGQGLGRRLLESAVAEARRRGCASVFVSTFSFQAPGFYQRLGFEVVAEARDKPVGHEEYILRRRLAARRP